MQSADLEYPLFNIHPKGYSINFEILRGAERKKLSTNPNLLPVERAKFGL